MTAQQQHILYQRKCLSENKCLKSLSPGTMPEEEEDEPASERCCSTHSACRKPLPPLPCTLASVSRSTSKASLYRSKSASGLSHKKVNFEAKPKVPGKPLPARPVTRSVSDVVATPAVAKGEPFTLKLEKADSEASINQNAKAGVGKQFQKQVQRKTKPPLPPPSHRHKSVLATSSPLPPASNVLHSSIDSFSPPPRPPKSSKPTNYQCKSRREKTTLINSENCPNKPPPPRPSNSTKPPNYQLCQNSSLSSSQEFTPSSNSSAVLSTPTLVAHEFQEDLNFHFRNVYSDPRFVRWLKRLDPKVSVLSCLDNCMETFVLHCFLI